MLFRPSSPSLLLILLISLSTTCVERCNAIFPCSNNHRGGTLGIVAYFCDTVQGVTRFLFESEEEEEEPEPYFFQENTLGTALMMADFVVTPLYLVAAFKYREKAVYEDGRDTDLSGFEADKIYTKVILSEILPEVGGELVFIANVENTTSPIVLNEQVQDQPWDALAVLYFPNSIAFGKMAAHPKFAELGVHKKAGLADTLVFACEAIPDSSMDAVSPTSDAAMLYAAMDDSDTPVATVDMIQYNRMAIYQPDDVDAARLRSGKNAVAKYDESVWPTQEAYGMRTAMSFRVKYSLIAGTAAAGWDEIRIQTYPSHAALEAILKDPDMELGRHHYAAGVQQESSFQVGPMFINSLGGNAQIGYDDACSSSSAANAARVDATLEVNPSVYCP